MGYAVKTNHPQAAGCVWEEGGQGAAQCAFCNSFTSFAALQGRLLHSPGQGASNGDRKWLCSRKICPSLLQRRSVYLMWLKILNQSWNFIAELSSRPRWVPLPLGNITLFLIPWICLLLSGTVSTRRWRVIFFHSQPVHFPRSWFNLSTS